MRPSTPPSQTIAADVEKQPAPTAAHDDDAPEAERTTLETATIFGALDMAIVATAIPAIASEFHSTAVYVYIGTAYMLANAACAPTWGKILDIFGRKPVLLAAVGVFWVGSLMCGLARNVATILAGRAVLANLCVGDLFSVRARGMCYGIFGAATIALFGVYEAHVPEHPVMPARIFRGTSNLATLAFVFCHGFIFIGGSYWMPLYFQAVLGVNALVSGVYLLPYVLGLSELSSLGKVLMVVGSTVAALGYGLLLDLTPRRQMAKLVVFELVAGLGVGCNFQSPMISLHRACSPATSPPPPRRTTGSTRRG